ncbi:hypothetical protein B1A99_11345 [Cohnella sp. CIP 111063]|jgi:hypothetical protein|uniref:hypothetical protein n=1 Tax=unclassified Cohnella TaxID=2636738 RepID=UPI000B8C25D8|nr:MULTISPECIES: hypothetical protein [unclassified Cohnella]OXS59219.1 hypothetical protein B1A99_11345 [Cohnella sp. CIP 111063]PRX72232.1 hypothetical protein B0G52_10698 [Cohnella sp. SGD-V74]
MNRINNALRFFKVTGELRKDKCEFKIAPWKLLLETQRYYEIKPENGAVKRIYKEKLNTTVVETKQYANGTLCCSAFCTEDRIEELQRTILKQLQTSIKTYMEDLQLNLTALNRYTSNL